MTPLEEAQLKHAEHLARVLSQLGEGDVDVLALLDALGTSSLKLDADHEGTARAAWEHAVEAMRHPGPE